MLFIYTGLCVGAVTALLAPLARYVDWDSRFEAQLPANSSSVPVASLEQWSDFSEEERTTPDPVRKFFGGGEATLRALLPKQIYAAPHWMGFKRFYIGDDLSHVYACGEGQFGYQWNDQPVRSKGQFLNVEQDPSLAGRIDLMAEFDLIREGYEFVWGPGPKVSGYESLEGSEFDFVCGPIYDNQKNRYSLHYARKAAWLGFPSFFAERSEDDNGPWGVYRPHRMYPFVNETLIENLEFESPVTATALTHDFDPSEFPFHWEEQPPARDYEWVVEKTQWKYRLNDKFTNYEAGLVVAAIQFQGKLPVLCLFTAHDGKLIAINPFPFGQILPEGLAITRLGFCPNGWMFATYTNDGQLHIFHTKTLMRLRQFDQIDARCDPREVALRMEWNSRGDNFLAYHQGDLVEVDVFKNRVQRFNVPAKVGAYAYVDSYDDVDTVIVASQENGLVYKFRLDGTTIAREARFAVAGLSPLLTYLNFSSSGGLLTGVACESTGGYAEPLEGKALGETNVRLFVWDVQHHDRLERYTNPVQSWRLNNGKVVSGRFVKIDTRPDGWHLLVNYRGENLVEIPSDDLTTEAIDEALLQSSLVLSPKEL